MSEQFNRSIVRFYNQNGSNSGTGFAINESHVVSCTHVIAAVLGIDDDKPITPGTTLTAEITLDSKKHIALAVIASFPRVAEPNSDEIEDITILQLAEAMTERKPLVFAPVRSYADSEHQDQPFRTYGFNKPEGHWHDGVCRGPIGAGWIQLEVANASGDRLDGLSGAPVWNKALNAIVGLMVAKSRDNLIAYMIPARKIIQAVQTCPGFQQNVQSVHLPKEPDSVFLEQVKRNIVDELQRDEVSLFKVVLSKELNEVLIKIGLDPLVPAADDKSIADGMVAALKDGGSEVPVITKALMKATLSCLDKRNGKYFSTNQGKHQSIKECVEQLLGWLILVSVEEQYLQHLNFPSVISSPLYFKLPVLTSGGVEIIVARWYQRKANLQTRGALSGTHVLNIAPGMISWNDPSAAEALKLKLWNQVFPDREKSNAETILTRKEVGELNSELEIRLADDYYKEHHILAIECGDMDLDRKAYQDLLIDLNKLTLVCFGFKEQQVFYSPENNLTSAVNRFLTAVNRALNQ